VENEGLRYAASLVLAGLASGFAGGLFGVGGGILRIPIFLYLFPAFGVAPEVVMHTAAGTSLALALPSSLSAAYAQHRAGNVDPGFLRTWLPALGAGVVAGLVISRFVPGRPVKAVFAVAVLGVALHMLFSSDRFRIRDRMSRLGRGIAAATIGALSALLGLTGGVFCTPTLTACGYSIHRAIAVSSVGGVLISAIGAAGYIANGWGAPGRLPHSVGYVDGLAFVVMVPLVLAMAPLGVHLANHLDKRVLRRVFGVFLVLVGIDMMRDVWLAGAGG